MHGILDLLHMKTVLHSRCLVKAKLGTESERKKKNFIITSHCFLPVLPAFQAEHVQLLLSFQMHILHLKVQLWGLVFLCLPAQWLIPGVRITHLSLSFQAETPGASQSLQPHPALCIPRVCSTLLYQAPPSALFHSSQKLPCYFLSAYEQKSQIKSPVQIAGHWSRLEMLRPL